MVRPEPWPTPIKDSAKDSPPPLWRNSCGARCELPGYKLGWIFVKPELENPRDKKGSYVFAPHFARTLTDLNNFTPEPMSDHSPMTVDLPFHDPTGLAATAN